MTSLATLPKPKTDPDIVLVLEEALERARAGDLTGILIVEQAEGYSTARYSIIGFRNRLEKLGVLAHAMHKLQDDKT